MINENYSIDEASLEESLTKAFGEKGTAYEINGYSSSGWTIETKGLSYKVSASGNIEEVEPLVEIATLMNSANLEENPYADKTKAVKDESTPSQTFYIPKDFKIASDSETEVDKGIVVEDKSGNQFCGYQCQLQFWMELQLLLLVHIHRYRTYPN